MNEINLRSVTAHVNELMFAFYYRNNYDNNLQRKMFT